MKTFSPLYEVYRRDDKTIVAQGTKQECDKLAYTNYQYSVRLSKQELYTKQEVIKLLDDILRDRYSLTEYDDIDIDSFKKWINDKL